MDEEALLAIDEAKEKMEKALEHLDAELAKIRAGKANPRMLDGIKVNYYGNLTPLNQVANINTPDARTIAIQPWEKTMIDVIEREIMAANLGVTPMNNGEVIRINIPPLTEERRRDLVKQVKHECENARISIRNARRDANEYIKGLQKNGLSEDLAKDHELEVQDVTDQFNKKVEVFYEEKEKDIMSL